MLFHTEARLLKPVRNGTLLSCIPVLVQLWAGGGNQERGHSPTPAAGRGEPLGTGWFRKPHPPGVHP